MNEKEKQKIREELTSELEEEAWRENRIRNREDYRQSRNGNFLGAVLCGVGMLSSAIGLTINASGDGASQLADYASFGLFAGFCGSAIGFFKSMESLSFYQRTLAWMKNYDYRGRKDE